MNEQLLIPLILAVIVLGVVIVGRVIIPIAMEVLRSWR